MKASAWLTLICVAGWPVAFWAGERSRGADHRQSSEVRPALFQPPQTSSSHSIERIVPVASNRSASAVAITEWGGRRFWNPNSIPWLRFLNSVEASELPAILEAVERAPSRPARLGMRTALLSRWAESDPRAALAYAEKLAHYAERRSAITAVVAGWSEQYPVAAAAWIGQLSDDEAEFRDELTVSIISRLTVIDPTAAIRLAESIKSPRRGAAFDSLFSTWAAREPAEAARRAEQLAADPIRSSALNSIAMVWAAADPEAALAWAQRLPGASGKAEITRVIFEAWAKTDPGAAARSLSKMPTRTQDYLAETIAGSWAAKDLSAARAWMESLPEGSLARRGALQRLVLQWAESGPSSALAYVLSLPAGSSRNALVNAVMNRITNLDLDTAIGIANAAPHGEDRDRLLHSLAMAVVQPNPKLAVEILAGLDGPVPDNLARGVAMGLANIDSRAAWTWAQQLPDGNGKEVALKYAVPRVAPADAPEVAKYLSALPASEVRNDLVILLANHWGQADAGSAVRWVQGLPDSQGKQKALASLTVELAKSDRDAAFGVAQAMTFGGSQLEAFRSIGSVWPVAESDSGLQTSSRLPDGPGRAAFTSALMESLAQVSAREAAATVARLAPGEAQNSAAVAVIAVWASRDPLAAAAWVSTFPAGQARETTMAKAASVWGMNDPIAAGQWVSTIADEASRFISIEALARQWQRKDAKAAQAWLAQSTLPVERQQRIIEEAAARR